MRRVNPIWKIFLSAISVLLTIILWGQGLQQSFDRPSVSPKLSLHQQEIALLALPAIPEPLRTVLVGNNPSKTLLETLQAFPLERMEDRERILLAALEPSIDERKKVLDFSIDENSSYLLLAQKLLKENYNKSINRDGFNYQSIVEIRSDPFLYQSICLALGGKEKQCLSPSISRSMAFKLIFSQAFPLVATLFGVLLLINQGWIFLRSTNKLLPDPSLLPLSSVDMVLLVAGGFVVLGEVVFPTLVVPFSDLITRNFQAPLSDALKVLVGYTSMTIPPLFILNNQLKGIKDIEPPQSGWLQWKIFPLGSALSQALRGWLMIMPLVLLTGWLVNTFVGDQGGSNPLLELVLGSKDPLALALLLLTTVCLAPLFEEVIFRGVLLPVLVDKYGRILSLIISAFIFAIAHLSVGELAPLFVLGIGLGLLRLTSGRLFPCVLMHSLWNGVTFANLLLLSN